MFKLTKSRVKDILIIASSYILMLLLIILGLIYSLPTNPVVNYLMKEKALNNKIDTGCLYYSSKYKKYGYIGYYFKVNNIKIRDLDLTLPDFPFAKKEIQFLNEFSQNFQQRKRYCYRVQYVQVDIFFRRYVFIYDLI